MLLAFCLFLAYAAQQLLCTSNCLLCTWLKQIKWQQALMHTQSCCLLLKSRTQSGAGCKRGGPACCCEHVYQLLLLCCCPECHHMIVSFCQGSSTLCITLLDKHGQVSVLMPSGHTYHDHSFHVLAGFLCGGHEAGSQVLAPLAGARRIAGAAPLMSYDTLHLAAASVSLCLVMLKCLPDRPGHC